MSTEKLKDKLEDVVLNGSKYSETAWIVATAALYMGKWLEHVAAEIEGMDRTLADKLDDIDATLERGRHDRSQD